VPYGGGGGAQGSGGASPYRLWDASEAKAVALFVFSAVNGCSGLGPKGLGNLAQASDWVVSPRDGKPCRGGGMFPRPFGPHILLVSRCKKRRRDFARRLLA
jgi:hypothetical protein